MKLPERILITGAGGFVGRELLRALREVRGGDVQILLREGEELSCRECGLSLGLMSPRVIAWDLLNPVRPPGLNRRPDLVLHLAASTDTGSSDHQANDIGTRNLLRWIDEFDCGGHFLYVSSSAVLDRALPSSRPPKPAEIRAPFTTYGRTKLYAEMELVREADQRGFALSILRPGAILGNDARQTSLLPTAMRHVRHETIASRLNWPGLNGIVHRKDVVEALICLATGVEEYGGLRIFDCASEMISLNSLLDRIYALEEKPRRRVSLTNRQWTLLNNTFRLSLIAFREAMHARVVCSLWRAYLCSADRRYCQQVRQFPVRERHAVSNLAEYLRCLIPRERVLDYSSAPRRQERQL